MCHLLEEVHEYIWDSYEELAKGSPSHNADSSSAEGEEEKDAPGQLSQVKSSIVTQSVS